MSNIEWSPVHTVPVINGKGERQWRNTSRTTKQGKSKKRKPPFGKECKKLTHCSHFRACD